MFKPFRNGWLFRPFRAFCVETVSKFFLLKRFKTFRRKTVSSVIINRFETSSAEAVSYSFDAQTVSKHFVVGSFFDVSGYDRSVSDRYFPIIL